MNRETFDALMLNEGWKCIGEPDIENEMSSDPNTNWEARARQIQYQRGMCLLFSEDEEIEAMKEEEFPEWFQEKSQAYYFEDDWKKAFKGSEFLIPVVEREIKMVRKFAFQDVWKKLYMIDMGYKTLEEVIDEVNKLVKE